MTNILKLFKEYKSSFQEIYIYKKAINEFILYLQNPELLALESFPEQAVLRKRRDIRGYLPSAYPSYSVFSIYPAIEKISNQKFKILENFSNIQNRLDAALLEKLNNSIQNFIKTSLTEPAKMVLFSHLLKNRMFSSYSSKSPHTIMALDILANENDHFLDNLSDNKKNQFYNKKLDFFHNTITYFGSEWIKHIISQQLFNPNNHEKNVAKFSKTGLSQYQIVYPVFTSADTIETKSLKTNIAKLFFNPLINNNEEVFEERLNKLFEEQVPKTIGLLKKDYKNLFRR